MFLKRMEGKPPLTEKDGMVFPHVLGEQAENIITVHRQDPEFQVYYF